ncbi:MAG: type III pantothenate kinase [Candidatus Marinimicrobia bacterium]|nr:type III pantothenate kinase [Candidatus Neomarinimicrobiota bacterium]
MLLVIDIGNTNTVVGIYRDKQLLESWRLVSSHTRTVDEYWIMVKQLCNSVNIPTENISDIAISSVVPELTNSFIKMSRIYFGRDPLVVNSSLNLGMNLLVREPKQIGADRLCNVVAAKQYYQCPLIVVDLGTATTFDVLNAAGDYTGGAISPGLVTGSLELIRRAAQLHEIDLQYPDHIIGKTTKEHMQSGIFVGHIAMIEGIVKRIKGELGQKDVFVIATGGLSEDIAKNTKDVNDFNKHLTLTGLRIIFNLNRKEMTI